ncbi:unnamed protein product [Bursaphelenchus okinawaensis]|uniref:Mediator of RNA polymerase II transcription subunit 22 n=1 Tax=Bursaphelenchus okinawaensis TaxID=465554 RepID=A0A811LQB3_9BILA|nr:unnamed protein product [Bursaphelenchus okinawaensis]CAG9126420.1 unnamed protein product [Bursaphelenchus okinawaensis]
MDLEEAKNKCLEVFSSVNPNDIQKLLDFLNITTKSMYDGDGNRVKVVKKLRSISKKLRKNTDISGNLPGEKILWPTEGSFSDCDVESTDQVDAFLYDDIELDGLREKGLLKPEQYCARCKSSDIVENNVISHSLSINELEYLFCDLLPLYVDFNGKTLIDIGSRLGAIVYAALLFVPDLAAVKGIEISEGHCKLQKDILKDVDFNNKAEILEGDFRSFSYELQNANLITMNNVFTFFASPEEQVRCWRSLKDNLKKETVIVHNHSIEYVTQHLQLDFRIADWVEVLYNFYIVTIMKRTQTTSSRSVTTKKLIVSEYRRNLKHNIRSLSENFTHILQASKVSQDEANAKPSNAGLMAEHYTLVNEVVSRTALMARAADDLLKLTNSIREFLILRDFNFISQAAEAGHESAKTEFDKMFEKYTNFRAELANISADIDNELCDNTGLRN